MSVTRPVTSRVTSPVVSRVTDGRRRRGGFVPTDADALTYITAVQAADAATLEDSVKIAIDNFVIGCKADGNWDSIAVSNILGIARTRAGAEVPLRGSPTFNGFVDDNYERWNGLIGNGSSSYINTNRANNVDGQNDSSFSLNLYSAGQSDVTNIYIGGGREDGSNTIGRGSASGVSIRLRNNNADVIDGSGAAKGFMGAARSSSTAVATRINGSTGSVSRNSQAPNSRDVFVYAENSAGGTGAAAFSTMRARWYHVGSDVDLVALDGRVDDLYFEALKPSQINVVLGGGQSNFEGRNILSVPSWLSSNIIANVSAWNGATLIPYDNASAGPNGVGRSWVATSSGWGAGAVALYNIGQTVNDLVVVQVSQGGSILAPVERDSLPQYGSWSADFDAIAATQVKLLEALQERYESLVVFCNTHSITLNLIGMIWHQGEADGNDASSTTAEADYQDNWQSFVDHVRGFTRADLPIFYGTIPPSSTKYSETVESAQLAVAADDANLHCRDNSSLPLLGDSLHFNAPGSTTFGEWLAAQVLTDGGITDPTATGGTITESGGYKIHTFTTSADFVVSGGPLAGVEWLRVGGGGGAGSRSGGAGGGGGAGGMQTGSQSVAAGTYAIVIGAGGPGGSADTAEDGSNGSDTTGLGGTTLGGGGGGGGGFGTGKNGGSGGGQHTVSTGLVGTAGTGTSGQGNNGGNAFYFNLGNRASGGGGGAGGVGGNAPDAATAGVGGVGLASSISGSSVTYATGGRGGFRTDDEDAVDAAANSGNGGWATNSFAFRPGGNGGSGIVIIRYPI